MSTRTVHDLAAYILGECGSMTHMKLQKLVYYSQAWALVWDEEPIFSEKIQAWANGPVVRELWDAHKGEYIIERSASGDAAKLKTEHRDTVDSVLKYYGKRSAVWLSELTHKEEPWKNARKGLKAGERSNKTITHSAMANYYGSL